MLRRPIVAIGGVNMDLIVRAPRTPKPGESLVGYDFKMALGGKASDQAVAVARLGVLGFLVSAVGDDGFGRLIKQQLEDYGVTTEFVTMVPNQPSGVAMIIVDETGQNSIVVTSGPYAQLDAKDISLAQQLISGAFAVLLTLEIPPKTIHAIGNFACNHGVLTVLDPGPVSTWNHDAIEDALDYVDIITPNETEAEAITGCPVVDLPSAEVAARKLLKSGVKTVILKMGDKGALFADARGVYLVPPIPVKVVDSTAAGDAFNAGLVVALAEGKNMEEALKFATCAGALTVTRAGAAPSLPTRLEVEERYQGLTIDDQGRI